MSISENISNIRKEIPSEATLVAISKTKPVEDILKAYEAGQKVFGENKIQEMTEKWEQLPKDIEWHMVGKVQRNKVKYMAPFVSLVHGVDSVKLLRELNKEGAKNDRVINCLLQLKIAEEETKNGINFEEAKEILESPEIEELKHVKIKGLMGMATLTDEEAKIRKEFGYLKSVFDSLREAHPSLEILSMGMSGDYRIALDSGSTMIRVGSAIFGERNYN